MINNKKEEIRQELIKLADDKYRSFHSNLCPGVENILGVRLPLLRKLAKSLSKEEDYYNYLNNGDTKYYEEIMIEGLIIGYLKTDNENRFNYIKNFIPKIDNWAICDSFCNNLKFTKENINEVWNFILPYTSSENEFDIRFAIVMMLNFYIIEDYIDDVLNTLNNINHDGYYVKMAVAWAVSYAYIDFPQKTLAFLKNNNLDNFTYNKSLQKIIESTRVSKEDKDLMRSLKKIMYK
ncbi:MAG: DNA alkylation repair protein [Terrisporobacter othiniensis]|uniref:DNA alkylation repair protein n=1 Tax=Terrisporobacter hibernicus TaxID=2813371 RepID=A0AAX2ZEW5_9FIRM|nr:MULTISPECIES: DNA alkylation repair protein [Terrisporobacter]MDU4861385.1 DNA alkylation repair protein [Terrisporobacter othiniensis]MDU6994666.1 DNA alkylation repair protein [Terrisporobacter othiniensis]UEL46237.1 DNA alkylation repair protein [Terrisporobacter hibernicus]